MPSRTRKLTLRYVGALAAVAVLLVVGQAAVQIALDRQEGDARLVNIAGRQRMLSQRICMELLAGDLHDLARGADEWEASQAALAASGNSPAIAALFAQIEPDHRAMLAAARGALAAGNAAAFAPAALAHQEAFLSGMDRIVAQYERDARARVVALGHAELALLALVLVVLACEGVFVFRPAVRGLRAYLTERDEAQQALVSISDREQQRIAQDLHDGLGQHLVGVSFLVKSLGDTGDPRIEQIGKLLAESIDQTRGLARSLYSHVLEQAGLVAALGELATHTERVFGVECHVRAEPFELAMPTAGHLYRIAREAVVNAAKHAKPTAIEIELTRDADNVALIVRDDGAGMQPAGDGMGLRLMEARAKMLGGSFAIATREPRGTIVSCIVPLGARA